MLFSLLPYPFLLLWSGGEDRPRVRRLANSLLVLVQQTVLRPLYKVEHQQRSISQFVPEFKQTQKTAAIYVSNHVSWVQTIYYTLRRFLRISFLSKREVDDIPYVGFQCRQHNSLYVERDNKGSRDTTLQLIDRRAKEVEGGLDCPIIIYPEGTTSNGQYVLPFKGGAFAGLHPIKPFCIKYTAEFFSPALDSVGGLAAVILSLAQTDNCGVCYQFQTIDPALNGINSAQEYSAFVRKLLARALGLPLAEEGAVFKQKQAAFRWLRD